nr:site-specific DNA-methyltransferase [Shuttleworthia satelles]
MDKMRMESINMTAQNIEKIGALFPNCITETKDADDKLKKAINFDLLRQMLSGDVLEGDEAYEFTWVGKKAAIVEANKPIRKTLRPCKEESVNWDSTENLYVEGDNLEVLKLLQESYLGKVKMIYIDPPYNTGHDFVYPDSFVMDNEDYNEGTGYFDEDGNVNYSRENSATAGKYHSDWCSMMYSRLMLARNLLSDAGAIFLSIDDNERDNLEKICAEAFGSENYVATFPWRKRTAKSDVPFGVSQDYEWVICFAKSNMFIARVDGTERQYYETPDYPGRPWRVHDLTTQRTASERPNSDFVMVNPKNGDEYPANPLRTWAVTKDTFGQYYDEGKIVFPGDYDFLRISKPAFRYWKEDDQKKAGDSFGMMPASTKLPDDIGMSLDGTKEITNIFEGKVFSYPKTTKLIKHFIDMSTKGCTDGIILDFFSGSATTAHAVMQLNAEDGGHRKFIMVQLPEPCDEKSEAYKAGYSNICEIGKERIRRAARKIAEEHPDAKFDGGFRVLKLDDTNMKDVYYAPADYEQNVLDLLESNIKEDRTDLDLLFGCLLEWGLPLSLPYQSEDIEGCTVHNYNDGDLIACFDENIPDSVIKAIAKRQPLRAVFRDSSFTSSPAKINVTQIFKELTPDTSVKVL